MKGIRSSRGAPSGSSWPVSGRVLEGVPSGPQGLILGTDAPSCSLLSSLMWLSWESHPRCSVTAAECLGWPRVCMHPVFYVTPPKKSYGVM